MKQREREAWLCDCDHGEHWICSACGDDWPNCECVTKDKS